MYYLGRGGGLFGFPHPTPVAYVTWFHILRQTKQHASYQWGISAFYRLSKMTRHVLVVTHKKRRLYQFEEPREKNSRKTQDEQSWEKQSAKREKIEINGQRREQDGATRCCISLRL